MTRLLWYVWQHSSFYRDFYGSFGITEEHIPHLTVRDLPFLTRSNIMDNFDRAVTDPRLRKSELERWIQENPDPKERYSDAFIVIHSSGTSGSHGIFVYSPREWLMADTAMASRMPLRESTSSERTRAAVYVASHGHFAMVSMAGGLDKSRYDTLILSLLDSREINVRKLNAFQPHRIYGYASSASALAEMTLEGDLQIRPTEVFVGGDKLTPSMIRQLRSAWNCLIYDTYGTVESKYLAFRESRDADMEILSELNLVEVLNDGNEPVSSGQEGRVVFTNLFNYTFPLIRYETGDYVTAGDVDADRYPVTLRDIRGRANDALPVALQNGVTDTIHPLLLNSFHVPGIDTIQFVSPRPEFVSLKYIAPRDLDSELREEFQNLLDMKGATKTTFEVERVSGIQVNPKTGKFELVRIEHAEPNSASGFRANGTARGEEADNNSESSLAGLDLKPDMRCVQQLFEDQAKKTGNLVAVMSAEGHQTYSDLNARANQLAHHLRSLGVGRGTIVAICLPRGLDLVAGILAILKAGGAWLPLDPRHPQSRKQQVLEDSGATFLVTEGSIVGGLPKHCATTVFIDEDSKAISNASTANPENVVKSGDLAYLMFTSGSTGRPKGVMVTHANLCQYLQSMRIPLPLSEGDIYLHTATIAFSSSVRQMFMPLSCGAASWIASTDRIQDPVALFQLIREQRITVLDIVPSYWRTCIDALEALDPAARTGLLCNDVRLIVTASEVLTSDLPRKWRKEFGHGAQLVNMFGQTETTGIVATYTISGDDDLKVRTVPIGKPIPNTRLHLLDDRQRPVPAGRVGQIFIGGVGVCLGYLKREDLTTERFVPDTFSAESGRIYKTGDLGRMRPDGNVEFIGRVDDQVKIRGIRIEPGEITAVLNTYPDLKEAVVISREDDCNNRRLVAYFVPRNGNGPQPGLLRSFLSDNLPEYMVPSLFVELDALPRLPSGKIDRHALPAPDVARLDSSTALVAPRNAVETKLIRIWKSVLAVNAIGVMDNFFDVGGNSLAAMYLLTAIDKTFGERLPLAALYQAPTVAELATLLESQRESTVLTSLLPLQTAGSKPPFFWIHGESSNSSLPQYLGAEQPVYGLGHQSVDGLPAQFTTVESIAAHYLEEMRTVQGNGPYFLGGYCFGGLVALEIARTLKAKDEDVAFLAVLEPSALFACSRPIVHRLPPTLPFDNEEDEEGIREKSSRHLRTLKELGFREQVEYSSERVKNKANDWTAPFRRRVKGAACALYTRLGLTLPVWLRSFYILRIYGKAARSHNLLPYTGDIDLFVQEPQHALSSCWQGLTTGRIEVHRIETSGHTAILDQPHVATWAVKLKERLNSAQRNASQEQFENKPAGRNHISAPALPLFEAVKASARAAGR